MSFEDLPRDWPHRPLSDPFLAAAVLHLCVRDADRGDPGLALLHLRDDGTLAQPCVVTRLPTRRAAERCLRAAALTGSALPGLGGLVVGFIAAEGEGEEELRALHLTAREVCRAAGVRLVGAYVVRQRSVRALAGGEGAAAGPRVA